MPGKSRVDGILELRIQSRLPVADVAHWRHALLPGVGHFCLRPRTIARIDPSLRQLWYARQLEASYEKLGIRWLPSRPPRFFLRKTGSSAGGRKLALRSPGWSRSPSCCG